MGVGSEFNEDLLIPLAEITGGNAYYIESPDQIPDAFRKELGVAFRISLRDLNLHLHLMNGVVLRNTYRVAPELGSIVREKKTNGHHTFPLGDYDPAMPVALLLEFIIPGWDIGVHTIASTHLSWQDPDKQVSTTNSGQDIQVQIVGAPKTEENRRVLNLVERVGAYKFGMRALEVAREGAEREDATMRLRQASTRLHELGEHTLADHLSLQADLLKKTGSLDPNITKKMRYQTRHLVRNVPDPPQDLIGQ
jgi:Ca-activated chloride channel family protein